MAYSEPFCRSLRFVDSEGKSGRRQGPTDLPWRTLSGFAQRIFLCPLSQSKQKLRPGFPQRAGHFEIPGIAVISMHQLIMVRPALNLRPRHLVRPRAFAQSDRPVIQVFDFDRRLRHENLRLFVIGAGGLAIRPRAHRKVFLKNKFSRIPICYQRKTAAFT